MSCGAVCCVALEFGVNSACVMRHAAECSDT